MRARTPKKSELTPAEKAISRKNRHKVIRTIVETIFLLLILFIIINALFSFDTYEPYAASEATSDAGFVALSYFGVDREGDSTLISTSRLDEHLKSLQRQGYVTITQEDIINYYENDTPLPERALFLMFEDGRRDTAIFAQKMLEEYNYRASMMTYAEKLIGKDSKYLKAPDLKDLLDSSYWELGTNGYRLYYINVFDRYDYFLGNLSSLEYSALNDCLGRNYNHYLMDYIRDKNSIPTESYSEMKARISADYEGMEREYSQKLGSMPGLYVLMHSNTGRFGNNERVSEVNAEWIYNLFAMNFNREGACFNTRADEEGTENSIYDLTRMQPQPYWYNNHLLMKIKYDSNQDITFINGDEDVYREWEILSGALECRTQQLVVTSVPEGTGQIRLKGYDGLQDFELSTTLTGNVLGTQSIYLRADEQLKDYIEVAVSDNVLIIREAGKEELFSLDLDVLDGITPTSVEEDQQDARIKEMESLIKYADINEDTTEYREVKTEAEALSPMTVEEGAEEYEADIDINELGKREVKIRLSGDEVSVWVDDKPAVNHLKVTVLNAGNIGLGCCWGGYGWSQRNLADDVYDGVFEELSVTTVPDRQNRAEILYDNCLHGLDAAANTIKNGWNKIINWFIKNL